MRKALQEQQQQRDEDEGYPTSDHDQPSSHNQRRDTDSSCFCTEDDHDLLDQGNSSFKAPGNGRGHDHGHDSREEGEAGFFSPYCLMHALTLPCGIALAFQAMFRGQIRRRYHIRGEGWEDGLAACCCGPCGLVQESRELEAEERTFVLKPVKPPKSAGPFRMFTL